MKVKMDYVIDGILVETKDKEAGTPEANEKMIERISQYAKRRDYLNAYQNNAYDTIVLRIRRDGGGDGYLNGITKEGIRAAAEDAGMSMSEYVIQRACEAMRQRGEVFPSDGRASRNEMFLVRGEMASDLLSVARELGEDPREMVLKAVRQYHDAKMSEGR